MSAFAVISEYNPFHNGHKYQLDTARELTGCDTAVTLMSGNYVQRGEFSIYPKHIRTNAALNCGADLVLENPALCVLRSAEGYASAAVYTLSALNCIDYLVFGAEHDNLTNLMHIAELLAEETPEFKTALQSSLAEGLPFASARSKAIEEILGKDLAELLKMPNNTLAVEYLKAIIRQKSNLKPILIKRKGAEHNSATPCGSVASASYIRKLLICESDTSSDFVPDAAAEIYRGCIPFNQDFADCSILSALCLMDKAKLASAPDISEGLENKIKTEVMKCDTLSGLIDSVKSKRYTHSRIKRAILCAYLGITAADAKAMPEYIKILGFNETGQQLLNKAKKAATLPLAKSAAPLRSIPDARKLWERELEFDKVYEILHSRAF